MDNDIITQLKSTSLFSGLSNDMLVALAERAVTRKLATNDVLMKKGEAGDSLFLIHTGWVKIVSVDSKGDQLFLNKCGPGEIIGVMSMALSPLCLLGKNDEPGRICAHEYSRRRRVATHFRDLEADVVQHPP